MTATAEERVNRRRGMKNLKPLTIDCAPDAARKALKAAEKKYGFVPNMMATFAHAPALLNGYLELGAAWEEASLTAKERQLVLLTASVENKCSYGIATHATVLKSLSVDGETIKAVRAKLPLRDENQNALVAVTRELVSQRGFVTESIKERFFSSGYNEVSLMEVLVGIALMTMTNYWDHLSPVSIDPAFQAEA
jgi:uncharacterized peroxidase-related enzyme